MKPILAKKQINLAMLGMVDGNGHPYSWSAIVNGYDKDAMAACPFATIPQYLGREPASSFGIPDVSVTHIWTDEPEDAVLVARASKIPCVVSKPEDVIGEVDAVIVATDKGHEHVQRCRPFVEAGLPVFIDKPLVDNLDDLRVFVDWQKAGAAILSGSSMRYSKEFAPYHNGRTRELGTLRYVSVSMAKTWERYGIHALEGIYPIIGPGFVSVQNTGDIDRNIVHLRHESGLDAVIAVIRDLTGAFGVTELGGTAGNLRLKSGDTFCAFKTQLESYIAYLRSGVLPFPFAQTVELMKIIIAGSLSREQGGRRVYLEELEV